MVLGERILDSTTFSKASLKDCQKDPEGSRPGLTLLAKVAFVFPFFGFLPFRVLAAFLLLFEDFGFFVDLAFGDFTFFGCLLFFGGVGVEAFTSFGDFAFFGDDGVFFVPAGVATFFPCFFGSGVEVSFGASFSGLSSMAAAGRLSF